MVMNSLHSKRGISALVSVMLLILIIMVSTGIIWVVVKNVVNKNLEEAQSCYDLLGKVEFNSEYTCYDPTNNEMVFSVSVGNINIEGLLVSVEFEEFSENFELTDKYQDISGLRSYNGSSPVKVPKNNSGSTYVADSIFQIPLSVEVVPILNGNSCSGEKFSDIGICAEEPPESEESCYGTNMFGCGGVPNEGACNGIVYCEWSGGICINKACSDLSSQTDCESVPSTGCTWGVAP